MRGIWYQKQQVSTLECQNVDRLRSYTEHYAAAERNGSEADVNDCRANLGPELRTFRTFGGSEGRRDRRPERAIGDSGRRGRGKQIQSREKAVLDYTPGFTTRETYAPVTTL